MASAYLRTIEFKANDSQLKRAIDKLTKSLTTIDNLVGGINTKFAKGLRGSLTAIGSELKTTVKVTKELSKAFATVDKAAKSTNKEISKTEKGLIRALSAVKKGGRFSVSAKPKGTITSLLTGAGHKNQGILNAQEALKKFVREAGEAQRVFASSEAGLSRQIAGFKGLAASVDLSKTAIKEQTAEYKIFADSVKAQSIAQQNLLKIERERITVRKGLVQGTTATKPTGLYENIGAILGREGAAGNTLAEVALYKGELEDALQYIRMGTDEFRQTEAAIERMNVKLGITTKQQRERTKALKEEKKTRERDQKDINKLLAMPLMEVGRALGGKRGVFGQLLATGGVLQGMKQMVTFVPFMNKKLKAQVRIWGDIGQKALMVMGGIKLASIGLTGILGATAWVDNAVRGFIDFENAASKAIWGVERHIKSAFSGFGRLARELPHLVSGALMTMPQVFGGQGAGGSPLDWMADGSVSGGLWEGAMGDRMEARRYGIQGGTQLQIKQKGLDRMNKLLEQRNRSAIDYQRILNRAVTLEREITRETKLQQIARDKASGQYARDLRKRRIEIAKNVAARKKAQREEADRLYMPESAQGLMVGPGGRRGPRGNRVRQEVWERYQRRLSSRKQSNERLREGLMLGAGFPMLFGGGLGSVAGGVGGAFAQSKMGPGKGFGAQILLSAAGQQVDAFVMKAQELGKALRKPTENLSALVTAAGLTGTALETQIKQLEKLGLKGSAATLVTDRLKAVLGEGGYGDLQKFSKEWEKLANLLSIAQTRLMAFVAGPLAALVKILQFYDKGERHKSSNRDALKTTRDKHGRNIGTNIADWFGFVPMNKDARATWGREYTNNMNNDPGGANAAIADRIAKVQGADNNDLAERVKLEQNRLDMSGNEFAIKEKQLDIKRQELEIEWQSEEYGKLTDAREKEALALKIKKLGLERQMNLALLKNLEAGTQIQQVYAGIAATIEDGLVNAIEGAIRGTKTLGDVATSVFSQIARSMLQLGVNSMLGMLPGDLGKYFKKRAAGGPVTGDTPYIVGEQGPELFVPNSSGNIVPNHGMGGSMVVNVDASGSSAEGDDDRSRQLGELIGAAVQSEIIRQQRPGGTLY